MSKRCRARCAARRCARRLSVKAAESQIVVLDALEMAEPKTKEMIQASWRILGIESSALILLPQRDEAILRSVRNLPEVQDAGGPVPERARSAQVRLSSWCPWTRWRSSRGSWARQR